MTVDNFALWKFKTIEGILKNVSSFDFTSTAITKGFETYKIHYDLATCTCMIEDSIALEDKHITCSFKDLPAKLQEMGLYERRPESGCNANALIPFTGSVEK